MCSDQLSSNQIIDFTIPRNKKIVEIARMKLQFPKPFIR